jgi:hypothetical protein
MLADNIYVCVRDAKGEGMRQAVGASGDYRHLPDVDGEALRETAAWRKWVKAQDQPAP